MGQLWWEFGGVRGCEVYLRGCALEYLKSRAGAFIHCLAILPS